MQNNKMERLKYEGVMRVIKNVSRESVAGKQDLAMIAGSLLAGLWDEQDDDYKFRLIHKAEDIN